MKQLKKTGWKVTALLLVMLMTLTGLSACGESGNGGSGTGSKASADSYLSVSSEEPEPESSEQPQNQTYEVSLAFVNDKYIAEGDESLVKLITDVNGSVTVPADAEGVDEACLKTLELLKTVPEGQSDLVTVIGDDIKFNSVTVDSDGKATVDRGIRNFRLTAWRTAPAEQFFIYQIAATLINSFSRSKQRSVYCQRSADGNYRRSHGRNCGLYSDRRR